MLTHCHSLLQSVTLAKLGEHQEVVDKKLLWNNLELKARKIKQKQFPRLVICFSIPSLVKENDIYIESAMLLRHFKRSPLCGECCP